MACNISKKNRVEEIVFCIKNRGENVDKVLRQLNKAESIASKIKGLYGKKDEKDTMNIIEVEKTIKDDIYKKYEEMDIYAKEDFLDAYTNAFFENIAKYILENTEKLYESITTADKNASQPTKDAMINAVVDALIRGELKIGKENVTDFLDKAKIDEKGNVTFSRKGFFPKKMEASQMYFGSNLSDSNGNILGLFSFSGSVFLLDQKG